VKTGWKDGPWIEIAGGGKGMSPPQDNITTLRLEDAEAIRNQVSGIDVISPGIQKRGMSMHRS